MKNSTTEDANVPTENDYHKFLQGLGVEGVYLTQSQVRSITPRLSDDALPLDVQSNLEAKQVEISDDGLVLAIHVVITAKFMGDERELAEISATFAAIYRCDAPPSREMFSLFIQRNLHIHVWPYAREYVQSTLGRFGWESFALPPLVSAPSGVDTSPEREES